MNVGIFSPMVMNLIRSPNMRAIQEDYGKISVHGIILWAILGLIVAVVLVLLSNRLINFCMNYTNLSSKFTVSSKYHSLSRGLLVMLVLLQSWFLIGTIQKTISNDLDMDNFFRDVSNQNNTGCINYPLMKERPNMIILTYDSGRADLFTQETFPNLWKWKKDKNCRVFPGSYSGGVQSDAGHISIAYNIIPTRRNMNMIDLHNVSSVSFDILRHNGYKIHALSSTSLYYCWALGRDCHMHRRVFDEFENAPEDLNLIDREKWTASRAAEFIRHERKYNKNSEPYLLAVYLEGTHYPYSYPDQFEKFVPAASRDQVSSFISTGIISGGDEMRNSIKNRYKNSLRYVDHLISSEILPLVYSGDQNTVFVLTSDHGEFLTEYGRMAHTTDDFYQEQTNVALMMCMKNIQNMPSRDVRSHIDLIPAMIEPYLETSSNNIGKNGFKMSSYAQSWWQGGSGNQWSFATYPWNSHVMLTDGNIKVWAKGRTIGRVTDMIDQELQLGKERNDVVANDLIDKWEMWQMADFPCLQDHKGYLDDVGDGTNVMVRLVWLTDSTCLDRKDPGGGIMHVYSCWTGWNQKFIWNNNFNGVISMKLNDNTTDEYLGIDGSEVRLLKENVGINWKYSWQYKWVVNNDKCMGFDDENDMIVVRKCDIEDQSIKWLIDEF
jgi:hypothetical protein